MWEFAEATRGLGDAARALGTPVVSGNVSLYNETSGRAIFPTPTIAVVGVLDDWTRHATAHFQEAGRAIVLLGDTREELGGSEWLALRRGLERGSPPEVDLEHERRLAELLVRGVAEGAIETAHDVAEGGFATALAECCFTGPAPIGARVALTDSLRPDALLFGEGTGRVIVATAEPDALLALAAEHGVPARRVGETGGDALRITAPGADAWIDEPVASLRAIWENAIPRRLGEERTA
jgi:phosphoribosylformylglycinamidine synthase